MITVHIRYSNEISRSEFSKDSNTESKGEKLKCLNLVKDHPTSRTSRRIPAVQLSKSDCLRSCDFSDNYRALRAFPGRIITGAA